MIKELLALFHLRTPRAMLYQLLGQNNSRQVDDALIHCSSLCGLKMRPKLRSTLLSAPKDLTISKLREEFAKNGNTASQNSISITNRQHLELEKSFHIFRMLGQDSTIIGRPSSNKLAWIIPDQHFSRNGKVSHDVSQKIFMEIKKYSGLTAYEWEQWLPWMSLGIAIRLRSWRAPKIGCLRRAMFKFSKSFGEKPSVHYPWESGFPENLGTLPIPILYQFEPDKKTLDGISTLLDIGLKQVNHLRILHPEAVQFAKDHRYPCKNLYKILKEYSTV